MRKVDRKAPVSSRAGARAKGAGGSLSGRLGGAEAPSARPDLDSLEAALGHIFSDRNLLLEALTHASAATTLRPDNQRLEFLGDRVLGVLTAEALLERHPEAQEGDLAPRLNALVRGETCAEIAEALDLGPHLRMARSESLTGGRRKAALLGDAMEALIAAAYLDGGWPAARAVFERHWRPRIEAQGAEQAPIDAKTALQEWAQARGLSPPHYEVLRREGPDHAPQFTIAARLETGASQTAKGASKRVAEQGAAAALLQVLREGERS
ncbi:MAG: ribonuclease III [Pseudomonadota bacterium]